MKQEYPSVPYVRPVPPAQYRRALIAIQWIRLNLSVTWELLLHGGAYSTVQPILKRKQVLVAVTPVDEDFWTQWILANATNEFNWFRNWTPKAFIRYSGVMKCLPKMYGTLLRNTVQYHIVLHRSCFFRCIHGRVYSCSLLATLVEKESSSSLSRWTIDWQMSHCTERPSSTAQENRSFSLHTVQYLYDMIVVYPSIPIRNVICSIYSIVILHQYEVFMSFSRPP